MITQTIQFQSKPCLKEKKIGDDRTAHKSFGINFSDDNGLYNPLNKYTF